MQWQYYVWWLKCFSFCLFLETKVNIKKQQIFWTMLWLFVKKHLDLIIQLYVNFCFQFIAWTADFVKCKKEEALWRSVFLAHTYGISAVTTKNAPPHMFYIIRHIKFWLFKSFQTTDKVIWSSLQSWSISEGSKQWNF